MLTQKLSLEFEPSRRFGQWFSSENRSWPFVMGVAKFVKLDWKEIVWRDVSGWESHTSGGLSD